MKKSYPFYRFTLLLVIVLWNLGMEHAAGQGQETYIDFLEGADLANGQSMDVLDDKIFGPDSLTTRDLIDSTYSSRFDLILELDPKLTTAMVSEQFNISVEMSVRLFTSPTDSLDTLIEVSLITNPEHAVYKGKAFTSINNVQRAIISILNVTYSSASSSVPPALFRLRGEISVIRSYHFDCADASTLSLDTYDDDENGYRLVWTPIAGASSYQLEWTYFDVGSLLNGNAACSYIPVVDEILYRHNCSRIETENVSYLLPNIYAEGCLFVRVRGVRRVQGLDPAYSQWNAVSFGTTHEDVTINKKAELTFAEEGRVNSKLDFVDGSDRGRQSLSRSSGTSEYSLISEKYTDRIGREAVESLPVPTFDRSLKFHPEFNKDFNGKAYSWMDFDDGVCDSPPLPMDSAFGASLYYSGQNPQAGNAGTRYTPDAEGYPFVAREYMPDPLSRVWKQSGAGSRLMLGSGHETRYEYGQPVQASLDRLFGNDVGPARNYSMEMVTDPNGQISITYKDLLRDKVIATSLAGNRPSAYDSLMESQSDTLLMGVITSHSDTLLTLEPNLNNAYLVHTEGDF